MIAIVGNVQLLMLEAAHVSNAMRNENIKHYKWRAVREWVVRKLSGRVVVTLYRPRNPSNAHFSHSLQESSPCLWTVLFFALFVFRWPYDLKVSLWNVNAYQQWYLQKLTCTYRRFYCTQCKAYRNGRDRIQKSVHLSSRIWQTSLLLRWQ
jgi:hypothetical protein